MAAFNASVLANRTHWMNYSTHEGQRLSWPDAGGAFG